MGKSFYASSDAVGLKISRWLAVTGFIVLAIMAMWIVVDVFSGIFRWGLPGMVDWVEVLNVICVALPLPYVTLRKGHISMTLIEHRLSNRGKHLADLMILTGIFLFSAVMAWRLSIEAWYSLKIWERNDVGLVVYWFPAKIGLAFGFIMTSLVVIIQLIGAVSRKREGDGGQK